MSHPMFALQGRRIVVTGAAGWLGAAMTRLLVEAGATVYAVGRDAGKLETLAASLSGRAVPIPCPLPSPASPARCDRPRWTSATRTPSPR